MPTAVTVPDSFRGEDPADGGQRGFPAGFLWGTATSAHQVEGHNTGNDWWDWEQDKRHVRDGTTSGAAADWWNGRAEEDLERAAALGQNAHRWSIEWSRLEPEPGRFDTAAFARYGRLLEAARRLGLRSLVTLSHFTLPRWLAKRGAWLAADAAERFAGFALESVRRLGPSVNMWATQNEPNVLAYMGYAGKRWPPGLGSVRAASRALNAMLDAHARAYRAIHRVQPGARVGVVLNLPWFSAAGPRRLDRLAARAQSWAFGDGILSALQSGRLAPQFGSGARIDGLAGSLDWLGLNYYGRYRVAFDLRRPGELFGRRDETSTLHTDWTDWGEPSPEGLTEQLLRLRRMGVPLYVTENGIMDSVDVRRREYLLQHVRAVRDAILQGAEVKGYFHWSLIDNFEWAEGWSAHFGLFALDRDSQTRTLRPSGELFAAICRSNGAAVALDA